MPEIPITIVRRGPKSLKPKEDSRTRGTRTTVPAGSTVRFNIEGGVTGTTITFTGDSPFGADKEVSYGVPLTVTVSVHPSDSQRNIYKYRCHGKAGNLDLDSEDGGGEVEIVHS
jgi:hypothetical protein